METPADSATREEGLRLLKAGQVSDAIGVLGKYLDSNPGDSQAHMLLGIACHQGGDRPRAAYHLEESLRIDETTKGRYNLGQVYESLDRLRDAEAQYRRALSIDRGYTNAEQALTRLEERMQSQPTGPRLDQTQAVAPPPGPYAPPPAPGGPCAPPPCGAPPVPPPFIARQLEEQRKVQEAHHALMASGVIYGAVCGAIFFLLTHILMSYVKLATESGSSAVAYLIVQVIAGAIYGGLIGLWIGFTAGDENSGALAGAVIGFVFTLLIGLIQGELAGFLVWQATMGAVRGAIGGYIIGRLVESSIGQV